MKTAFSSKVFANIFYLSRVIASTIGSEFKVDSQDFKGKCYRKTSYLKKKYLEDSIRFLNHFSLESMPVESETSHSSSFTS